MRLATIINASKEPYPATAPFIDTSHRLGVSIDSNYTIIELVDTLFQ